MADRRLLTVRYLNSLPPAPKGKRVEVFASHLSGFGLRISDTVDPARPGRAGRVTFILFAGSSPALHRPSARSASMARSRWSRRGKPIWRRSRLQSATKPSVSGRCGSSIPSPALTDTFLADKVRHERKAKAIQRDFRHFLIAAWRDRPISEITALDVLEIVNRKKRSPLIVTPSRVDDAAHNSRIPQ